MHARRLLLITAVAAASCGCHPRRLHHVGGFGMATRPLSVASRLSCPDDVGQLSRTAETPDGASCTYAGPRGELVQLSFLPLGGATPQARLASLDRSLQAELPAAAGGAAHGQGVYVSSDHGGGQAHIDLPGFHLNASDGKADIQMPGVSINANGDDAKVTTGAGGEGQATVNAHSGGAEIRTGGVNANGAKMTYLLASDLPGPTGYSVVGYRAEGPAQGPLVLAVFRAKGRDHHGDMGGDGLDRLVSMNVHG